MSAVFKSQFYLHAGGLPYFIEHLYLIHGPLVVIDCVHYLLVLLLSLLLHISAAVNVLIVHIIYAPNKYTILTNFDDIDYHLFYYCASLADFSLKMDNVLQELSVIFRTELSYMYENSSWHKS